MDTTKTTGSFRAVSVGSLIFAVLGAGFFWWVPMGIVLSLTGLFLGIGDWTFARRRSLDYRLAIAGVIVAVLALCLDAVIAGLGLQTWTFGR